LPELVATIVHVWSPPFASAELRHRLETRAASLDELGALLEREGAAEAERIANEGVALARAVGWKGRPLAHKSYGGEGFELARLAQEIQPAVLGVGARGLSGVRALLGSVSDMVVHYSPVPVLVVPHPLLFEEREAARTGPVVIGHDGSDGARAALAAAASLFEGRELIAATVGDGGEPPAGARSGPPGAGIAHEHVVLDAGHGLASGGRRVADTLAAFAAERAAAVVVVGSRGRSAARKILLGSAAMATVHHAERPVLVVPGGDRFAPSGGVGTR